MQNYLTADNLTVGYRGKPILSDISMNIRRGSIVTLIGPNGAGKSTILKSIIRELSPLGGSVFLDGTALEDYSDPDFAKKTAVVMTGRPDPELMTCFDVAAAGRYPYTGRFGILSKEEKGHGCPRNGPVRKPCGCPVPEHQRRAETADPLSPSDLPGTGASRSRRAHILSRYPAQTGASRYLKETGP